MKVLRLYWTLWAIGLFVAGAIIAAGPAAARPFSARDVWGFEQPAHALISPDGRRLIYSKTRRDPATDTRVTTLEYTTDRRVFRTLAGLADCSSVVWAPDSRRVALVCAQGDGARLLVRDLDSGSDREIAASPDPIMQPAWSPDGKTLAYLAFEQSAAPTMGDIERPAPGEVRAPPFQVIDKRLFRMDGEGLLRNGFWQIHLAPADGALAQRPLTHSAWWSATDLSWSGDGRQIYVSAIGGPDEDSIPEHAAIYAVRSTDGKVRSVVDRPGAAVRPTESPDGRWLAFLAVDERGLSVQNRRIHLIPLAGGREKILAPSLDRSIEQIAWAQDSQSVLASFEDQGNVDLARISLSGDVHVLTRDMAGGAIELPFGGTEFSADHSGSIAYVRSLADQPPQVAVIDPLGRMSPITRLNADVSTAIGGFLPAQHLAFKASTDGRLIDAWWVLPRSATQDHPAPLILDIHGGPFGAYGDRFSLKYQLFAAAGYAVLYVDPRGSTGYGEAFANLAHDAWPGHDVDDLLDAVNTVGRRPEIDADNIFATGTSGGATLTIELAARQDRIRAGVAVKPVVNWTSWVLASDVGNFLYRRWLGGKLPWQDGPVYWARSPLSLAPQVHAPLLLLAGEQDKRTPASEAVQMYTALKLLGKDTELMLAPGVTHESGRYRPSLFLQECSATLAWFERYRSRREP